jgi:hypothetical protein
MRIRSARRRRSRPQMRKEGQMKYPRLNEHQIHYCARSKFSNQVTLVNIEYESTHREEKCYQEKVSILLSIASEMLVVHVLSLR